ncbi:MAG: hypothetical protein ACOC56_04320 [Atribacterota bacterium]
MIKNKKKLIKEADVIFEKFGDPACRGLKKLKPHLVGEEFFGEVLFERSVYHIDWIEELFNNSSLKIVMLEDEIKANWRNSLIKKYS